MSVERISPDRLYRPCDPAALTFETTANLEDLDEFVGHERAVEAVGFGISMRAPGFNVYAMGPEGIGKYTLVRQFLLARAATEPVPADCCYVYNFDDPRRPRLLTLPAGRGRRLRDRMAQLSRELKVAIAAALETEQFHNRKQALEDQLKQRRDAALVEFERRALSHGVALLRTPIGVGLAPIRDGRILEASDVEALPEEARTAIRSELGRFNRELSELLESQVPRWEREHRTALRELTQEVTRSAAAHLLDDVRREFEDLPEVVEYLGRVLGDVVENAEEIASGPESPLSAVLAGRPEGNGQASFRHYRVNLLVDNADTAGAPVVFEDNPTTPNLTGRVEHAAQFGTLVTDFALVRAGALHRANGGYLVLDARKVLSQPYAWDELKRALRAREIQIESIGERLGLMSTVSLEPQPVPLDVKVLLVGDRVVYYLLSALDPDFSELFKVQADFDDDVSRTIDRESRLAHLLGTVARREGLRPLDRGAASRLVEHAARVAGDGDRLSMHMRTLTDIVREADELAALNARDVVMAADVDAAIVARHRRASRVQERVLDQIERGTILVEADGAALGQVNGLTVTRLGEATLGWPVRITARVGLGSGEIIDIEREVELGGPIHSKGVLILAGFIAGRYGRDLPLSLHATLVFEQSYGGVEGDSASLAETCALLSALAGVPCDQGYAITGSVNQHGAVQPIGAVNEKIEGWFDVCAGHGLTGRQGVIIPASNVAHLMLRADVVEAVRDGRFSVVSVATIDDAIGVLTAITAGERDAAGSYPDATVNGRVAAALKGLSERAREFSALRAVGTTNGHARRRTHTRARETGRTAVSRGWDEG